MEEKRYPTVEEEGRGGIVSEPIAAPVPDTMSVEGMTEVHDWIDDLDWDKFPSFGPFSDEEAIARIDRFEEKLRKGEEIKERGGELDLFRTSVGGTL